MGGIGAPELIIVLVILLLVFGGAKLPKLARSLGEARREFEKTSEEEERAALADPALSPERQREDDLRRREDDLRRREDDLRRLDDEKR